MSRIVLISITAALLSAAPAVAHNPTRDTYGGRGDVAAEVATGVDPGSGVRGTTAEGGRPANAAGDGVRPANAAGTTTAAVKPLRGDELPFTGLDLGLVAGGGILLLGLGFGVRRVSREPATPPVSQ